MSDAAATKPWGPEEKQAWRDRQRIQRSYNDEAIWRWWEPQNAANPCGHQSYGEISYNTKPYSLFVVKSSDLRNGKPNILITGGVHGYEVGGVKAALRFVERDIPQLSKDFNFVVFPCISPWAYEMNTRFNPAMLDPNRHFSRDGQQAEECVHFMNAVEGLGARFRLAIDLHETTTLDTQMFREKAQRDGDVNYQDEPMPNGFYAVMHPQDKGSRLGSRVIEAVRKVTPIATDQDIYGDPNEDGIVCFDAPGLLMNFALQHADEAITTEPCRDQLSEHDIEAQIAAIRGALEHVRLEL